MGNKSLDESLLAGEIRVRIVRRYQMLTGLGRNIERLVLGGKWYEILKPTLVHEEPSGAEVFVSRIDIPGGDSMQVVLPVVGDEESDHGYYRLEGE